MANQPRIGSVGPSLDATAVGPVHPVDATDLYGAGAAPSDQRYTLSPREHDAWEFAVGQAAAEIAACARPGDTVADGKAYDGPYDAGTLQPGVPVYGMAGG